MKRTKLLFIILALTQLTILFADNKNTPAFKFQSFSNGDLILQVKNKDNLKTRYQCENFIEKNGLSFCTKTIGNKQVIKYMIFKNKDIFIANCNHYNPNHINSAVKNGKTMFNIIYCENPTAMAAEIYDHSTQSFFYLINDTNQFINDNNPILLETIDTVLNLDYNKLIKSNLSN